MKKYVVSVISTKSGSHEVHIAECTNLPQHVNDIGEHESYQNAMEAVSKIIPKAHACPFCIPNLSK
ncbi:MAG TPA: hypothetical protein VK921_07580 [Anditalea sp.]|nr:hypothetical protein [Anditalea sp.]